MAFTFPTSPTNGQTYVMGGVTYTYNSANDTWVGSTSGGASVTTGLITGTAAQDYQKAATAPTTRSTAGASAALVEGDQWYDTANDILKVRSGASTWISAAGGASSGTAVAWVNFDGDTGTIRASKNVSSVSGAGTGGYAINFTTALPSTGYSVTVSAGYTSADCYSGLTGGISTTSVGVYTYRAGNFTPMPVVCVTVIM